MKYDKESYNAYASKLDARDKFMFELKKFVLAHGYVPEQYKEQYDTFSKEDWKSWRCQSKVVKKIKRACKKTIKVVAC